jgi:hypothetical protein
MCSRPFISIYCRRYRRMELYLHSLFRFHGVTLRSIPFLLFFLSLLLFSFSFNPHQYILWTVLGVIFNVIIYSMSDSINKPAEICSKFQVLKNRRMEQQVSSSATSGFYLGGFRYGSRSSSISPDNHLEMFLIWPRRLPILHRLSYRRRSQAN